MTGHEDMDRMELDSLSWVIQLASHKRLNHEQALEVAAAVLRAGWAFRVDLLLDDPPDPPA